MGCSTAKVSTGAGYLRELHLEASLRRIPLHGTVDLTYTCNLRCVHCYLGPQAARQGRMSEELDSARLLSLIDEIAKAGCLFLVLSGGDPLVREDFPEIYAHARRRGLLVTILTKVRRLMIRWSAFLGNSRPGPWKSAFTERTGKLTNGFPASAVLLSGA